MNPTPNGKKKTGVGQSPLTPSCRMPIYGMKDLLLTQEQITHFDRAMDAKKIIEHEQPRETADSGPLAAPIR
jgi:hypothetical protein